MAPSADRRVFFVGDSYVVGVGDPRRLGWVGRLAEWSDRDGLPIVVYNLGVRRDTSDDVARRWPDEVAARRAAGSEDRLVVSFGVNDTTVEAGRRRVAPDRSLANLRELVARAAAVALPLLVVGPPPVDDPDQDRRVAELDERFAACAAEAAVPYVAVHAALAGDPRWTEEVAAGDGAHPGVRGYTALAELVAPPWRAWVRGCTG